MSKYLLFGFALILTFLFYQRNIELVLDMNLYIEETDFLKSDTIVNSRLFWKGEYFFLILLKGISLILPSKIGIYTLVFLGMIVYLSSLTQIARNLNLNPIIVIILTFSSLYFYLLFGNTIRQGLALAISFLSLRHLLSNNKKTFLVLAILALLTHKSTLILFVIPILHEVKSLRRSIKLPLTIILICASFAFINDYLSVKLLNYGMENADLTKDLIKLSVSILLSTLILTNRRSIPDYFKYTFYTITILSLILIGFSSISSRLLLYNQALTPFIFASIFKGAKNQFVLVLFSMIYLASIMNTTTFKSLFPF